IYAASLWKAAQVGFGLNFSGISRAAGSNLLRRIRLMLDTERKRGLSTVGRLIATTTICTLVVFLLAIALSTRANVSAARFQDGQAGAREKPDDQGEKDGLEPMSAALKPTILYKERASYTPEAKDNKVEGLVVLKVIFAKDGHVRIADVVRGL